MKFFAIAVAFVILSANAKPASGQEIDSQDSKNQRESVVVIRVYEAALAQLQKFSDIAQRELLKETSARDLRFRCGRYWVDAYSKLIAPDDREIGIWGVDSPARSGMPAIQLRR